MYVHLGFIHLDLTLHPSAIVLSRPLEIVMHFLDIAHQV
jgi:hypothetical protein